MTKNKEKPMATDDRAKALEAALGQIEKQFARDQSCVWAKTYT